MQNDPIVDEVRQVRDEHAAKFNYDLQAIFEDIKRQEQESSRKFVSYADSGTVPSASRTSELADD